MYVLVGAGLPVKASLCWASSQLRRMRPRRNRDAQTVFISERHTDKFFWRPQPQQHEPSPAFAEQQAQSPGSSVGLDAWGWESAVDEEELPIFAASVHNSASETERPASELPAAWDVPSYQVMPT